jgi:hypothetical protein
LRRAYADRLDDLARTVVTAKDEKERLAAVIALGKSGDDRSVPALIRALDDKSPVIRGVAAAALGHLGDERAQVPLERKRSTDVDPRVRKQAGEALVRLADRQAHDNPVGAAELRERRVVPRESARLRSKRDAHVLVVVKSAANQTRAGGALMGDKLRGFLVAAIDASPDLASDASSLARGKTSTFQIDGAIVKMKRVTRSGTIELTCDVSLSISTPGGKILSVVTGSATLEVPRRSWRKDKEASLWDQALENAVKGAHRNLRAFVTRDT